ncbi:autophagy-related protein 13 isoform X3, partial [Biomphalaria glabrata]
FCITVADNAAIEEQIRKVLEGVKCFPVREQSICVEIPLVTNDGDHMFLETWDISFNLSSLDTTASKLQHVFTRM